MREQSDLSTFRTWFYCLVRKSEKACSYTQSQATLGTPHYGITEIEVVMTSTRKTCKKSPLMPSTMVLVQLPTSSGRSVPPSG